MQKVLHKTAFFIFLFAIANTWYACSKNETTTQAASTYQTGVFVSNEGVFGSTGTLSFWNTNTGLVTNDLFRTSNQRVLGDVLQSVYKKNAYLYLVVNNANKIEVVSITDIKSVATITNLQLPRYILSISDTIVYVSEWGSAETNGSIAVINTNTNTIIKRINIGSGPERMLYSAATQKVYVACKGGFGNDNRVFVINTNSHEAESFIEVGFNPNSLQMDVNGALWVLCSGKYKSDYSALEQKGALYQIDITTNKVLVQMSFSSSFSQPSHLCINQAKNTLFYLYDSKIYALGIHQNAINENDFLIASQQGSNYYALDIHPSTDDLYVMDAASYVSAGSVYRYDKKGAFVSKAEVGIIPNGCWFME